MHELRSLYRIKKKKQMMHRLLYSKIHVYSWINRYISLNGPQTKHCFQLAPYT